MPTGYDRLCLGKTREERAALPGFSETPVVRMQIPDDVQTSFDDLIAGRIDAPVPDDQVILKADGFPTYHLAVVVDDHLMGITHVVPGQKWISSTPKHLLLYRWLGIDPPAFAHMPLLRDERKAKISKRLSLIHIFAARRCHPHGHPCGRRPGAGGSAGLGRDRRHWDARQPLRAPLTVAAVVYQRCLLYTSRCV